ncbi:hypothetical protein PQX77_018962, partial [Marasmius sp. AFHP31]
DRKLDVEYGDWQAYYVDLFGNRDLFMRHRGGGVGYSTRVFTVDLEHEATEDSKPLPVYNKESGEMLQDVPEDPEGEEEEDEEDGDNEDEDKDADEESQKKPIPLSLFKLLELSSSSDESLRLSGYDSDDDGGDWTDNDDAADGSD